MFELPHQQLTFFQTVKLSIWVWWKNLLVLLPLTIPAGVLGSWPVYLKHLINPNADIILFSIAAISIAILSLIPYLSIFAKLGYALRGQPLSLSQSLAASLLKLPSAALLLLMVILVVGAPIAFGILGFMMTNSVLLLLVFIAICCIGSVYLNCSFPLLVLDNVTPLIAIKSSFALVKDHWWYVGGVIFVISLFTVALENVSRNSFGDSGFICAFCLILPLHIAASIILLQQLKLRKKLPIS